MSIDFSVSDTDSPDTRTNGSVKKQPPGARAPYRNDTTTPKRRRKDTEKPTATRAAIDRAINKAVDADSKVHERALRRQAPQPLEHTRNQIQDRAHSRVPPRTGTGRARQQSPGQAEVSPEPRAAVEPAPRAVVEPAPRGAGASVTPTKDDSSRKSRFAWPEFKIAGWVKYSLMALVIALMVAVSFMKPIDKTSESQIDSAMTRALIGFGIARTLNGVISVAQGTEFAVQPAGVGVNFSPGEILDPVNDLVERFSWVMLVATSSLGIQKILLEVSSWIGISFMLAGAAFFWLLTKWQSGRASALATFASRLLLVMLVLRFLIPLGSIANDWVYRQFLEPRFESSSQELEVASERIREISTRASNPSPEASSISQKAKNFYNSMTSKFDFDGMLQDYKNSAENVSEHAVNLIVVFLLQTIIFPLLFLYLIYRTFRYLLIPPSKSGG